MACISGELKKGIQVSAKPTVVVRNLEKSYFLTGKGSSKSLFKANMEEVKALKPCSIVANSGESIGILGKNGSGKSTLLRLVAGAESPTGGEVIVSEQPTLLGVSAALQRDLSGRQNVRLGLLAMGVSPDRICELEPEVITWAELDDSIDRPIRTYSSGMIARLKFSISTAVPAEILLVDEALSTGDASFTARAQERMNSFLTNSGTVFLVSHAAKTVEQNCNRAIWLHEGEIIADGNTKLLVKMYRRWSRSVSAGNKKISDEILSYARRTYKAPNIILESEAVKFLDAGTL